MAKGNEPHAELRYGLAEDREKEDGYVSQLWMHDAGARRTSSSLGGYSRRRAMVRTAGL